MKQLKWPAVTVPFWGRGTKEQCEGGTKGSGPLEATSLDSFLLLILLYLTSCLCFLFFHVLLYSLLQCRQTRLEHTLLGVVSTIVSSIRKDTYVSLSIYNYTNRLKVMAALALQMDRELCLDAPNIM